MKHALPKGLDTVVAQTTKQRKHNEKARFQDAKGASSKVE
jgi:hypothetical protein